MRWIPVAVGLIASSACKEEPATFTEVRDDILLNSCALSSCHGKGTGDLTLDPDNPDTIYDAIVGVASTQNPDIQLVKPGDPDNSYLVMKLEASADITGEGDPMPPPFGMLERDPETVERVRSWIEDGAKNN